MKPISKLWTAPGYIGATIAILNLNGWPLIVAIMVCLSWVDFASWASADHLNRSKMP